MVGLGLILKIRDWIAKYDSPLITGADCRCLTPTHARSEAWPADLSIAAASKCRCNQQSAPRETQGAGRDLHQRYVWMVRRHRV